MSKPVSSYFDSTEINWEEVFKDWKRSELSQRIFCEQKNIKLSTFCYYRLKLKKSSNSPNKLLPLKTAQSKISDETSQPFTVRFKNGIQVLVPQQYAQQSLQQLLELLGAFV